jgi:predicted transcriptional regulator
VGVQLKTPQKSRRHLSIGKSELNSLSRNENVKIFQGVIEYLSELRRSGQVDNRTFDYLIKRAATQFVEAEISDRVQSVMDTKIAHINKNILEKL